MSEYTEECSGCLAEYNGECTAVGADWELHR